MKYIIFFALLSALSAFAKDPSAGLPTTSSDYKILEDLKVRAITADQAWLYRVQARFNPSALPEKYRPTKPEDEHSHQNDLNPQFMNQVLFALPKMKAATQRALIPFLMPPAKSANKELGCPGYAPIPEPLPDGVWIYDDRDPVFRFWYVNYPNFGQKENEWMIKHLLEGFNKVRSKYEALLGKTLLSDAGGVVFEDEDGKQHKWCDGGNGKYDVYLNKIEENHLGMTVSYPGKASKAASFMIIDPVRIHPFKYKAHFTAAHELFHAFQFVHERNLEYEEYTDSDEGMANWAANWALDGVPNDEKYAHAYDFMARYPEYSLTRRDYDSWFFYYFIAREHGNDIIARILQEEVSKNPFEAMENVLPGGFRKVFPEFSIKAYNNEDIVGDSFKSWDGFIHAPFNLKKAEIKLDDKGEYRFEKEYSLGIGLSRAYQHIVVDKGVKSISLNWGKGAVNDDHFHFRLLKKVGGSWKSENWDPLERPVRYKFKDSICFDDPEQERFEEALIVITRSDIKPPYGYWDQGKIKVRIGANNIPCYAVEGKGGFAKNSKRGTRGSGNYVEEDYVATFVTRFEAKRDEDGRLTNKFEIKNVTASYKYSMKTETNDPCAGLKGVLCKALPILSEVETCEGSKSGVINIEQKQARFAISDVYTGQSENPRAYEFKLPGVSPGFEEVNIDCPKSADFKTTVTHPELRSQGTTYLKVKPDGEMHDEYSQPGQGTLKWDFLAPKKD